MRLAFALSILFLPGCVGGGCNQPPTPSTESCEPDGTSGGTVSDVTIGRWDGETFTAYVDGDIVPITYGGQGFPMLVFNLRVRGSDLPGCLEQSTTVYRDGVVVAGESLPLVTEHVLADTWITGDMLVVTFDLYGGEQVVVESQVQGVTASVGLWVDHAVDAGLVDAGPVPDAMPPDA